MFIFLVIESIPINALDKPLREKGNWDDEEEETADKDKASKEEPKHQKGSTKLLPLKEFSKLLRVERLHFPNPLLPLFLRRLLKSRRKERPR